MLEQLVREHKRAGAGGEHGGGDDHGRLVLPLPRNPEYFSLERVQSLAPHYFKVYANNARWQFFWRSGGRETNIHHLLGCQCAILLRQRL